jgi:hypothetical protein
VQRQREKGVFKRMMEVINEPRFKFYVKEGRLYTMKTGVPGVWEEVARRIQEQTADESERMKRESEKATRNAGKVGARVGKLSVGAAKPRPLLSYRKVGDNIKRQTTRQSSK